MFPKGYGKVLLRWEPGTDGKFPIFLRARLYRIEISFQRPKLVVLDDPALFRDAHPFAALDGGASHALRSRRTLPFPADGPCACTDESR